MKVKEYTITAGTNLFTVAESNVSAISYSNIS